jgi:AcrR family transcriptional regulator
MATKKKKSKTPVRRGKGRPVTDSNNVGAQALIEATIKLLKRAPPAKISAVELAREANVDPKLVRYYFGDKSSLMTAVIKHAAKELAQRRASSVDPRTSFHDRLQVRIKALVAVLAENPHLHEMLLQRVVYGEAAEQAQIEELRQPLMVEPCRELELLIKEGVAAGKLRMVDARYLYIAIIGMCEFPVNAFPIFSLLFGKSVAREEVLEGYAKFLGDLVYFGLAKRPREP